MKTHIVTDPPEDEQLADHPSSELIADYLNGKLLPAGLAAFESHMAECRDCRQQVTSARLLLATYRTRRRNWKIPAAAAAALAWLVLARPTEPEREIVRAGAESARSESATAALRIVAPTDGDTLDTNGLVFVWHNQPGQPLFRLSLSDASGRELWAKDTRDTTLVLPANVILAPGRTYFWNVDALGADGRSHAARTQRFTLPSR